MYHSGVTLNITNKVMSLCAEWLSDGRLYIPPMFHILQFLTLWAHFPKSTRQACAYYPSFLLQTEGVTVDTGRRPA